MTRQPEWNNNPPSVTSDVIPSENLTVYRGTTNQYCGRYSLKQIQELVATGSLRAADFCQVDGRTNWESISTVLEKGSPPCLEPPVILPINNEHSQKYELEKLRLYKSAFEWHISYDISLWFLFAFVLYATVIGEINYFSHEKVNTLFITIEVILTAFCFGGVVIYSNRIWEKRSKWHRDKKIKEISQCIEVLSPGDKHRIDNKLKTNCFWRNIYDMESAKIAAMDACWISIFIAASTAILATMSLTSKHDVMSMKAYYIDVILFAFFAWRIKRMSRFFSVIALGIFIQNRIIMLFHLMKLGILSYGFLFITIMILLCLINGVRGTFAFHKYNKDTPQT